jgi:hypothetical protein
MSAPPSSAISSRLAEGARLKEEGNAKLLAKDYKGAVSSYKKVFLYTRGLDVRGSELSAYATSLGKEMPSGDQEREVVLQLLCLHAAGFPGFGSPCFRLHRVCVAQVTGLVISVCSNLSLAYLHLNEYERVVQYGNQVRCIIQLELLLRRLCASSPRHLAEQRVKRMSACSAFMHA